MVLRVSSIQCELVAGVYCLLWCERTKGIAFLNKDNNTSYCKKKDFDFLSKSLMSITY